MDFCERAAPDRDAAARLLGSLPDLRRTASNRCHGVRDSRVPSSGALIDRRSRATRVGAALVDPIDDRLNLLICKIRHPRRFGVGGHLSELAGIVVEQRPGPL